MDFAFCFVSDGMGGAKAGEYASRIAVEKILSYCRVPSRVPAAGMESGFEDLLAWELSGKFIARSLYLGGSYEECSGMEATLSLCWFTPGWLYFLGHIGDSRIYLFARRVAASSNSVTMTNFYVGWLFRNGKINEREARTHPRRNVLQKSLGGNNQFVDPQVGAIDGYEGRRPFSIVLEDGLVDGLYDERLEEFPGAKQFLRKKVDPARCLVEASLENSGRDNTTALVIQVVVEAFGCTGAFSL